MQLSPHFTLSEFTASQIASRRGIPNDPPIELYPALRRTAEGLERIREIVGGPIIITSGYRCIELNQILKSDNTSQHVLGEAADIYVPGLPAANLAQRIDANRAEIQFDQLILEYPPNGWVHVSFSNRKPRMLALTKVPGQYLRGIQA